MDLFFLVMPSILFALLEHRRNAHATEVKSIKKNMEKDLNDENNLQINKVKANIDFIRAVEPKGVGGILFGLFAVYLALIAVFHVLDVWGVLESKNSLGSELILSPTFWTSWTSWFPLFSSPNFCLPLYMLGLVGITCYRILWVFSREKKKIVESYRAVKLYIKSPPSFGKGIPDDLQ